MRRITLSQYRRKAVRRKIKAYNHNACVFPMSVCARAIKCAGADHSVARKHNCAAFYLLVISTKGAASVEKSLA